MKLIPAFLEVIKIHFTAFTRVEDSLTIIQLTQDIIRVRPQFRDEIVDYSILDCVILQFENLAFASSMLLFELLPPSSPQPSLAMFRLILPILAKFLRFNSFWYTTTTLICIKSMDLDDESYAEIFVDNNYMQTLEYLTTAYDPRISKNAIKIVNKINIALFHRIEYNIFVDAPY